MRKNKDSAMKNLIKIKITSNFGLDDQIKRDEKVANFLNHTERAIEGYHQKQDVELVSIDIFNVDEHSGAGDVEYVFTTNQSKVSEITKIKEDLNDYLLEETCFFN
jgi:kynurenine formamidase